jgi:signal transduction histidine kinase
LNEAIKRINLRAEKLKEFSSDVAHEFKTSLMIMNSEIDYSIASKKYKNSFDNIKVQVKFLDYLINSLLSLTRLENKKLETEKTNISDLIKLCFSDAEMLFNHKDIRTISNIKDNVFIEVNENLFKIVINNLIFNAFKYTNS